MALGASTSNGKQDHMTLVLLIILVLVIGGAPVWPYSRGWTPWPSGIGFILVVILLILIFTGHI